MAGSWTQELTAVGLLCVSSVQNEACPHSSMCVSASACVEASAGVAGRLGATEMGAGNQIWVLGRAVKALRHSSVSPALQKR